MAEDLTVFCSRHPNVETVLRCNRCGAPICPRCAVLTEVGYRCPDCIRSQQDVFFNIRLSDYPVAALVSGSVAGLAALPLTRAGFFIAFLLSPVVGGLVGELVHRSVGRRRGRHMWLVVGSAVVMGGLFVYVMSWLFLSPASPLVLLLYLVLCAGTAAGRLR